MSKGSNVRFERLLIAIGAPFVAGFIGSVVTAPSISTWYAYLTKPSFSPPNWIFAPAWTLLYILMGLSFYLIIKDGIKKENKSTVYLFLAQLVLNSSWSIAFFGLKSPLAGLMVIIPLWLSILVVIIRFYRVNKTAGLLNIPYLLWVSFASYLNLSVFLLNS